MKRVGIGVIGTGFWGENQVRVLRQSQSCDLLAICDTDENRARQISEKYAVPFHTNLDEFLATKNLEAVTICTPTQTHFQVAMQALEVYRTVQPWRKGGQVNVEGKSRR